MNSSIPEPHSDSRRHWAAKLPHRALKLLMLAGVAGGVLLMTGHLNPSRLLLYGFLLLFVLLGTWSAIAQLAWVTKEHLALNEDIGRFPAVPADVSLSPFQKRLTLLCRIQTFSLVPCMIVVFAGILIGAFSPNPPNLAMVTLSKYLAIGAFGIWTLFNLLCSTAINILSRAALHNDGEVCPTCRYWLRGLPPKGACPECGQTYEIDAVRESWTKTLVGHLPGLYEK